MATPAARKCFAWDEEPAHKWSLSLLVAPDAAETPEQRVLLLQEITQAADEARTVQDALRAILARVCERMGWQAGRLQFTSEAGDLAQRTFWHLVDPEKLVNFRSLAEERRQPNQTGLLARVVREGKPTWTVLPEGPEANATGTRAVFAFPILAGKRVFAVLEFFSEHAHEPRAALLDTLGIVCAGLGGILQRKPAEDELRKSERDYRALFESAHDAILIVDPVEAIVLDANRRCSEIYGFSRDELIGLPLDRVWRNPDRARLLQSARGEGGDFEAQHLRKDGRVLAVDVAAGPVEFRGRPAVWMSNRDVTDRARTLAALRTSEERYRLLFDASPLPMWVFDLETLVFLAVNEAAVARYGYSREQFMRMTVAEIGPTEGFDGSVTDHAAREVTGAASVWRHKRASGDLIDVEITSHELEWGGKPARLVVANDVTERLRAEQKLWHAAFYDGLTGLPNRQLFMERLGQALERTRGRDAASFAVFYLDLDRFKIVNDSMGHRAGDQLLVSIARRLERTRRAGDTVARLGGDEFAVLVEGVEDPQAAGRVAERVQHELSSPFEVNGQEVFTSASIGIALGGSPSRRPEDLLRDADTAMYRAKALGVARHAVFDISMHDHAVATLQLENDLRRAIDRSELRVMYQPILRLFPGRAAPTIVGFEALVRWQHPKRGLVSPAEFIPMAEETGVIGAVGKWVLAEACGQMRSLQQLFPRTPQLSLSVNLSGRQILQPGLVEQIAAVLEKARMDPRTLRLELTESVLVENEAAALRCLLRLRSLGLKLAIDDFGTGYSSLSYLHRMPIDVLKIDASFVRTMGVDEKNRRIVETVLLLGKNLGVEVIAEGVETQTEAQTLQVMGCELVQGFLYSEPVDIDAMTTLLREEAAALRALKVV